MVSFCDRVCFPRGERRRRTAKVATKDRAAGPAGGAEADDEGGDPGGGLLFVGAGRAGERAHLAATLAEEER